MHDRRRAVLTAAVGFALLPPRSHQPEVGLLRRWLDTWAGIGVLAAGMARQGCDLQLTRYADKGWQANFYPAGIAHSVVSGSGWAPTPWRAVQRGAWAALTASAELPTAELYASDPDGADERRQRLTGEAERLQAEIGRFTEAVRLGGPLASLVAALRAVEQQRADVLAQLEHLDGLARAGTPWGEDVRSEIRRRMTEWRAMLLRHPGEARQILRKLIVGRLTMTPRVTAEDPGTKSPARQRMARC